MENLGKKSKKKKNKAKIVYIFVFTQCKRRAHVTRQHQLQYIKNIDQTQSKCRIRIEIKITEIK